MTPRCFACGYAVEWLRSCYESDWKLFTDSDQVTRGYYYFSPPGTPFFPGGTNLWSRNWVTDELGQPAALGEQPTRRRPYRNGALVVAPPPPFIFGSAACLSQGEAYPPDVAARTLIAGISSECWTGQGLTPPVLPPISLRILPFGFCFQNPSAPGPGPRVPIPLGFAFRDPSPPGPGPRVPIPLGFAFRDPSPPGPGPRVPIPFAFSFGDPRPPGPGRLVPIQFRFSFGDPRPPGPGRLVPIPFAFSFGDPTNGGPGPRARLPLRFDFGNPTGGGPGTDAGLFFSFDFGNPTGGGPGTHAGLFFTWDWNDPTPPGPGPRVDLGFSLDFVIQQPTDVVTLCDSAGTPAIVSAAFTHLSGTPPAGYSGSLIHNPITGRWEAVVASIIYYLQCTNHGGGESWYVGVIEGGTDQFGSISTVPGQPYGVTMFAGTWPVGSGALQVTISP